MSKFLSLNVNWLRILFLSAWICILSASVYYSMIGAYAERENEAWRTATLARLGEIQMRLGQAKKELESVDPTFYHIRHYGGYSVTSHGSCVGTEQEAKTEPCTPDRAGWGPCESYAGIGMNDMECKPSEDGKAIRVRPRREN